VAIVCLLLLLFFLSSKNVYASNDNKITFDELQRIKLELDISDDYPFNMYNDSELLRALNQKKDNNTYGQAILTALDELHLISNCYPNFYSKKATTYFNNILDRFSSTSILSAESLSKLTIKGAVKYLQVQKISLGVSTLFLLSDLAEIGVSLKKLRTLLTSRALFLYLKYRDDNDSHNFAWNNCGVPPAHKEKATESYFKNLWEYYGPAIKKNNLQSFFREEHEALKELIQTALEGLTPEDEEPEGSDLVLSSPLSLIPDSSYYQGDEIKAKFSLLNRGLKPVTLSVLTVGGRDPDKYVADFSHQQNVTIEASDSYAYQGTLKLNKTGDYHFFCTYQTPDGEWNTSIDLSDGLTDEDRVEDIEVKEREEEVKEAFFKTFYYEDDWAEYSVKYPDWPDISELNVNHPKSIKSLNLAYFDEVIVSIIISQDVELMDLFKLVAKICQEESLEEAKKNDKRFDCNIGETKLLKELENEEINILEGIIDLKSDFNALCFGFNFLLNSSKVHFLFKSIFTEENNKYFSISMLTSQSEWEEYEDIANKIIGSMKYEKIEKEKILID
jgi:hypothetical protein